jgi:hypothetical protein
VHHVVQLAPYAFGKELFPLGAPDRDRGVAQHLAQRRIGRQEVAVNVEREQADRHRFIGVLELEGLDAAFRFNPHLLGHGAFASVRHQRLAGLNSSPANLLQAVRP